MSALLFREKNRILNLTTLMGCGTGTLNDSYMSSINYNHYFKQDTQQKYNK